ncbi:MAG: cob(I)yrinic acid a,c-diamide adenosyltransferase [Lachnospiraceae bacterium]|nr:cob(I)yrinic acid a,c-diamide adenosyltransferase [Lachnospiraceae bacterium]
MGLLHLYCGDGKGKTTAAIGLAIRGAGAGMRVHMVQFLKGRETAELAILAGIPQITVSRCEKDYGFTWNMTPEEKEAITLEHNRLLAEVAQLVASGQIQMLILDEFVSVYRHGLLDRELAERLILQKPPALELVLTGRNPDEKWIEAADYVSEIRAVKHPYERGIGARYGIEY